MADDHPKYQVRHDISPEHVAALGVETVEEARAVLAEKGYEGVLAEAAEAMAEEEKLMDAMVVTAHDYISRFPTRTEALANYYGDSVMDLGGGPLDAERLLMLLVMACFRIAEAENNWSIVVDGQHRTREDHP